MSLSLVEQQILLAAFRLSPDGYGVTIRDEIERVAGKKYSYGTIYTVLERLCAQGFLKSRESSATAERGGRSKLTFEIDAPGQKALDQALRDLDALRAGTPFGGRATA